MANWFYYDVDGQKVGPVDSEGLKRLAADGLITSATRIETEAGREAKARDVKGLEFAVSPVEIDGNSPETAVGHDTVPVAESGAKGKLFSVAKIESAFKLIVLLLLTLIYLATLRNNSLVYETVHLEDQKTMDAYIMASRFVNKTNAIENGNPSVHSMRAVYDRFRDIWTVSGIVEWTTPEARIHRPGGERIESTFVIELRQIGSSGTWIRKYLEIDGDVHGDGRNFF